MNLRNSALTFAMSFLALGSVASAQAPLSSPGGDTAAAMIIIDSPTAGQTVHNVAIIKFHTENMKIASPFSAQAAGKDSANFGHLHVTVDGGSWHWVHSSGDPVVIGGLSPGQHRVQLELAANDHKPLDSQTVTFTITTGETQ